MAEDPRCEIRLTPSDPTEQRLWDLQLNLDMAGHRLRAEVARNERFRRQRNEAWALVVFQLVLLIVLAVVGRLA